MKDFEGWLWLWLNVEVVDLNGKQRGAVSMKNVWPECRSWKCPMLGARNLGIQESQCQRSIVAGHTSRSLLQCRQHQIRLGCNRRGNHAHCALSHLNRVLRTASDGKLQRPRWKDQVLCMLASFAKKNRLPISLCAYLPQMHS